MVTKTSARTPLDNAVEPSARLRLNLHFQDGSQRNEVVRAPATIGRDPACDVRIRHWRVARVHARLDYVEAGVLIEDLGSLAGTTVNGKRVARYAPLAPQDDIVIGPCLVRVSAAPMQANDVAGPDECGVANAPCVDSSLSLGDGLGWHRDDDDAAAQSTQVVAPPDCLVQTEAGFEPCEIGARAVDILDGEPVRAASYSGAAGSAASAAFASATAASSATAAAAAADSRRQRDELRDALLQALDLRRRDVSTMSDAMLRVEAASVLERIVAGLPQAERPDADLVRMVLDEVVGLGPLERLLEDPAVTEIMVNRYDQIYVERAGRLAPHDAAFSSEQSLLGVIEKIVTPLGRRIDESSPMVDARLPDGSRVHAIIAPVALKGAALTLRKFPQRRPAMGDLLSDKAFDRRMADFLALCVRQRKNLIVAGGTGSGKTTLINVLSHCVPDGERIVTIEDAAELRLQHRHLIALEARPPNLEGKGGVSIRDLVRNALRMRPDRIIVGECRGAEAFDMLAAMNTGHEGSLTSLHANSPRDALARLETMILMAGMSLPLVAVREHIAASIDLIVQQSRLSNGRRLVSAIVEVTGIESGCIQLQEIYRYDRRDDVFRASGLVPDFVDQWREQGIGCDMSLFSPERVTDVSHPALRQGGPA